MIRVLHVMASGERGGGADHLVGLLPELSARGVTCQAIVGDAGPLADRLREAGIPTTTLALMGSRLDPTSGRALVGLARDADVDLIHCHGTRAAFQVLVRPKVAPTLYTAHGLSYRQRSSPALTVVRFAVETLICRRADEVISVSYADIADLRRRGALRKDRGVHIPNAIDAGRFHPRDGSEVRQRIGLPLNGFVVGTVARLVPQKGVACLIEAMSGIPNAILAIAGDGPLRSELEAQAKTLGVDARFLGARDDVEQVLSTFDLFVLPSLWEGEPIALLEAMATRRPCIAAANTGAREIVRPGVSGLLTPVGDPAAMRAAIQGLREDPSRASALGAAGFDLMADRTWANAAASVEGVYREVLARRG